MRNPSGARVYLTAAKELAIALAPQETKNKKLPPGALLLTVDKGAMQELKDGAASADIVFEVDPKTVVYAKEHGKCLELRKLVKTLYPTTTNVWSYAPFAPGALPGALARTKRWGFIVDDRGVPLDAIGAARTATGLDVRWVFDYKADKKQLLPFGVGIFNDKQLVLTPNTPHIFKKA